MKNGLGHAGVGVAGSEWAAACLCLPRVPPAWLLGPSHSAKLNCGLAAALGSPDVHVTAGSGSLAVVAG